MKAFEHDSPDARIRQPPGDLAGRGGHASAADAVLSEMPVQHRADEAVRLQPPLLGPEAEERSHPGGVAGEADRLRIALEPGARAAREHDGGHGGDLLHRGPPGRDRDLGPEPCRTALPARPEEAPPQLVRRQGRIIHEHSPHGFVRVGRGSVQCRWRKPRVGHRPSKERARRRRERLRRRADAGGDPRPAILRSWRSNSPRWCGA